MRAVCCLVLLLSACLESGAVLCDKGSWVCAPNQACDLVHRECVRPDQLTSCIDRPDGEPCEITSPGDGVCDLEVCIVKRCGDGQIHDDEACDGTTMPEGVTCLTGKFYYPGEPGTVTCNDACGFDFSACVGRCGDGTVDPGREVCEPTIDPVLSCVDFGYGAGVLGCTMCAPGLEDCKRFGWDNVTLPFATVDLHGTTDDNVFVLGENAVAHFDGTTWSPVDLAGCTGGGQVPPLYQVWAIGDREAFVSSASGALLHLTSSGCTTLQVPTTENLSVLWASSPSDVYVIATSGVWHFDGSTWTMSLAGSHFEVWGSGPTNVFVADNANQIHRFTGTWAAPQTIPGLPTIGALWGTSATDVYASGMDASNDAYVARFDGTSWSASLSNGARFTTTTNLTLLVAGAAAGGTLVVSGFENANNGIVPIMAIGDATGWTEIQSPTPRFPNVWVSPSGRVHAISADSSYVATLSQLRLDSITGTDVVGRRITARGSDEVFVGGGTATGRTYRWDGFGWLEDSGLSLVVDVGPQGETYGLPLTGGSGMMLYTPGAPTPWALARANPSGIALAVVGTNDVWYLPTSGVVSHWLGTFTIPTYPLLDRNGDPAHMRDVWAHSATAVFAVGTVGTIQRWNGSAWEPHTPPTTDDLIGVFGLAADDVYAWSRTTLLHYDGTSWAPIALPPAISLGRLWAASATDVFVTTTGHGVQRYDGARWAPVNFGTTLPLVDVTGVGTWVYVTDSIGGIHQILRTTSW